MVRAASEASIASKKYSNSWQLPVDHAARDNKSELCNRDVIIKIFRFNKHPACLRVPDCPFKQPVGGYPGAPLKMGHKCNILILHL